jgi:hypothetical protein
VEAVVEEIAEGIAYQSRHFLFYDERFGLATRLERVWVARFAQEVVRRGLCFCFGIETCAADAIHGAVALSDLRGAGLRHVALSLGSLLPAQGKRLGAGTMQRDAFQALEILSRLGLDIDFRVVFWDAGSTLEEAAEHLEILERIGTDHQLASVNRPPWLEAHRDCREPSTFEDPKVRDLWREGLGPFRCCHLSARRLPALSLHVPALEFEQEGRLAAALRTYGETLSRAERKYFAALLGAALRCRQPWERRHRWKEIHDEHGPLLQRCAAAHPTGVAARLLNRSSVVWPMS